MAKEELAKRIKEYGMLDWCDLYKWEDEEEERIELIIDDIMADFSDRTGIGSKGYDVLSDLDSDAWEWASDIGKKETGILELYMLAFKLAMEQIESK